jgi:Fur family ferric uptake transcriptional regulator
MSLNNNIDTNVARRFRGYLSHKELRATPERMTVLQEIFLIDSHFNAENLYIRLHNKDHKISRATVYRTLELLVDSGLVRKTVFEDHIASFEKHFDKPDHAHFICTQCGRIIEFYDQSIQTLHRNLEQKFSVRIINHTHQIYGKCKDCNS